MTTKNLVKLGEFITIKHGYAFPGEFITSQETKSILVTPGNFNIGGGFKSSKLKYFADENYPSQYKFDGGELIVTMTDLSKETDTLGYAALVPNNNKIFLHNQRVGLVQILNNALDKMYLYWKMRTREYQEFIANSASGTSVMHTSPKKIYDYEFSLPQITEQKAIASVLSSLDDKIDLLHRQNKTLESMAETLFRQWFIVNEQEQWSNGTIEDLYVLQRGFDLPSNQRVSGEFNLYAASGLNDKINSYKVDYPTIITGRSGVIGNVFYSLEKSWPLNTTLFIKNFKKPAFWFAYFHLKTLDLASLNSGSAVPTLNRNHVHSLAVKIPPNDLISKFEDDVSVLMIKFNENLRQIINLEKLRDTLLPKLMSGEVQVLYAEEAIASVA